MSKELSALELTEALEAFYADPDGFPYMIGESIAMLRQFDLAESIIKQQQAEIETLKLGDIQWKHAMDLAKIEITDLKAEIEALKATIDSFQATFFKGASVGITEPNNYDLKKSINIQSIADFHYNKGHEDGRKLATVKELTGGYEVMALNEYDVTVRMPISDWEEILRKAGEK